MPDNFQEALVVIKQLEIEIDRLKAVVGPEFVMLPKNEFETVCEQIRDSGYGPTHLVNVLTRLVVPVGASEPTIQPTSSTQQ